MMSPIIAIFEPPHAQSGESADWLSGVEYTAIYTRQRVATRTNVECARRTLRRRELVWDVVI